MSPLSFLARARFSVTVLVGLRSLIRLPSSSSELSFPVFKLVTKYLSAEKKLRFYENLTEHLYHGHRSAASLRCITLAPDNRQTTLKRGSIIVAFINTSTNSCRSTEKGIEATFVTLIVKVASALRLY